MQKNFEKTDNNGKIMNDISQKESLSTSKKEKIGFEKYRTKSFVSKLSLYIKKFRFSEKELLMIKQRFNLIILFLIFVN